MIDKLGFLVRFWELKARLSREPMMGEPLAPQEQLELLSLMQLVTHDLKMPEPGPVARTKSALPAQLIGEGTILATEIRFVSAAAIVLASLKPVSAGERVLLRAADAVSGVEYTIPCLVEWMYEGAPCMIALAVDGMPMRGDFATPTETQQVRSALSLGRHERLVG